MFEQQTECCWHWCFELHRLTRDGMIEAQEPCVQAQTVKGIVAVAVFGVATDGMAHVG